MAKMISCRDVGVDCDWSVCAQSEAEVFQKAAEHARKDHNMSEIPKELRDKMRSYIREVERC